MEEPDYFELLPNGILLKILLGLPDLESVLAARATCRLWNQIINSEGFLDDMVVLRIRFDSPNEFKALKKQKWDPSLMAPWDDISVMMSDFKSEPNNSSRLPWGSESPFKLYFPFVKKLTIIENGAGSCSMLDFVHSMACAMPKLQNVWILEAHWKRVMPSPNPLGVVTALHKLLKSWRKGMKRIKTLKSIRIAIYSHLSTQIYIKLFTSASPPLVTIDIDLSKNYGLPFHPLTINHMYRLIFKLILRCSRTLRNLRIKWDHRVEEDLELIQYTQDTDPFVHFLMTAGANTEELINLKLKVLFLGFPSITFFSAMAFEVLLPFLRSQEESLEQVHLSRCKWDMALQRFNSRLSAAMQRKIEYTIYMLDLHEIDHHFQNNRAFLLPSVRGIDFHSVCTERFTLESLNVRKRMSQSTGRLKWAKHSLVKTFRLLNSTSNVLFQGLNLRHLTITFRNIHDLDLIDSSGHGYKFTNDEFNNLFLQLTKLRSLKMTNLSEITDAGICCIPEDQVRRMRDVVGVVYPTIDKNLIPITNAKYLKFLEMRDLSKNVSDVSIFLAIQYIPKLEKIGFHGTHQITEWGQAVLFRKFKRNPFFAIYLQPTRKPIRPYLLDFP